MYRLRDYTHGLPDYMGLGTADTNTIEYNWVQVYGIITVITGLQTNYFIITRKGEKWRKNLSNYPNYFEKFKDDSGALESSRMPKLQPQTKHINFEYHYLQ